MPRPHLPEHELHDQEFRVRLQKADAELVRAAAKKTGIKPAEIIRVIVKARLTNPSAPIAIELSLNTSDMR